MSTKLELLYEKIYTNFITGIYGTPKIPTSREIAEMIERITKDNDDPITKNKMLKDLYISEIHETFDNIIDDLEILYSSIENQSNDILDQLTNSLKEHNGVKRELRNIKSRALDIQAGKMGKNYLQYVHTDTFSSMENLNINKTTSDPETKAPVVDIKAGHMYIPNILANLIDLTHYYQRKLDIVNTGFVGQIKEAGYVGSADAGSLFDISNDKRLVYRVQTNVPTAMKSAFVIQLDPNRNTHEINGIALTLDADNTVGHLQVQYKKDSGWEDIPEVPITEITTDRILLRFESIETTHLKFQFIKEGPDILDSNEYFIVLGVLTIFNAKTYKSSVYHSKSIKLTPYNNERPIIGNVAVEAKGYIPNGCAADVFIARDKLVKGYFVDRNDEYVLPDSTNAYKFIKDDESLYPTRHILLSDAHKHLDAQDIEEYRNLDYDWQLVKSFNESDGIRPAIIQFVGSTNKPVEDNRLYNELNYLFGDSYYNSGYPQIGHPDNPDDWFLSGVIDETNPLWIPYMSGLVASGYIASSGTYGDATGFPFNAYNVNTQSTLKFGDVIASMDGWYRPSVDIVTPSGYNEELYGNVTDNKPDFMFNGQRFYEIYKFASDSNVVPSTVKLYTYQTLPYTGSTYSYTPANGTWRYNSKDVIKTIDYDTTMKHPFKTVENDPVGPPGSGSIMIPIPSGGVFIKDSVRNVHYLGFNNVLQRGVHYNIQLDYSLNWWVDMYPASTTEAYSPNQNVGFTYSYITEDKYASYWDGYIIAREAGNLTVIQLKTSDNINIVNRVKVEDLDGNVIYNEIVDDDTEIISLAKGSYRYKIFCLTDEYTRFSYNNWSPYDTTHMKVGPSMQLVGKIDELKIVDLDILIHTTPYENDNRVALIDKLEGDSMCKFVVVKEPSLNLMQGYYFHSGKSQYESIPTYKSRNTGHYQRKYLQRVGATGYYIEEYITGSIGNRINSTTYSHDQISTYDEDLTWNDGVIYPPTFSNTDVDKQYTQHSSYGYELHLDDIVEGDERRGHLFYNTAENLADFYSITYGSVNVNDPSVDRFLYKIELKSEHKVNTPILDAVKFTMNVMEEEYES